MTLTLSSRRRQTVTETTISLWTREKRREVALLSFDPGPHIYTHGQFVIPNVTSILEPFLPYGGLPEDVRQKALQRGTLVHKLTELDDCNELTEEDNESIYQAGLDGYLKAWRKFRSTSSLTVTDIEVRVYHTLFRYAGTVDRVGYLDSERVCIEIKTGSLCKEYALQTAAYQAALNEGRMGPEVKRRVAVCLRENGTFVQAEHDDPTDFQAFVGALNISNWRKAHHGS